MLSIEMMCYPLKVYAILSMDMLSIERMCYPLKDMLSIERICYPLKGYVIH
jgi:hypothetical protein